MAGTKERFTPRRPIALPLSSSKLSETGSLQVKLVLQSFDEIVDGVSSIHPPKYEEQRIVQPVLV